MVEEEFNAIKLPSTNNGLEATNRVIKSENTFSIGQFLNGVTSILLKWSKDCVPNSVNCLWYADSPTLSLKMWTEEDNS